MHWTATSDSRTTFATQASNSTSTKNSKTIIRPSVSQPQELSNSFGQRRESKPLYEQQCRKRTEKPVRSFPRFAPSAGKPWYRSLVDQRSVSLTFVHRTLHSTSAETLFGPKHRRKTLMLGYSSLPRRTRRQSFLSEMFVLTVLTTCLSGYSSVEVFRFQRTVR